jgi:hypothetical protein
MLPAVPFCLCCTIESALFSPPACTDRPTLHCHAPAAGDGQGTPEQEAALQQLQQHALLATTAGLKPAPAALHDSSATAPAAPVHMPAVVYTEASAKPDYSAPPSSSSPYVYLSTQLGCPLDLAGSLSLGGSLPWVVTSPRYHQLFPQLLPAWGHLLQKLGARRLLALQHHDAKIINRPGISCSPWLPLRPQLLRLQDSAEPLQAAKLSKAQAKALKGELQHRWEVADCRCPDLERLVSGLVSEDEVTKAERLLAHLGAEWGHYKQALEASVRWVPGERGQCWVCSAVGPLLECVSACPCFLACCSCLHALYPLGLVSHTDMRSPCHVHGVVSTFLHPHFSPPASPLCPSAHHHHRL